MVILAVDEVDEEVQDIILEMEELGEPVVLGMVEQIMVGVVIEAIAELIEVTEVTEAVVLPHLLVVLDDLDDMGTLIEVMEEHHQQIMLAGLDEIVFMVLLVTVAM